MTLPSARDPAVRALPPRQRQAYLRYLDEGDHERAADVLERSPLWRASRSRQEAQEAIRRAGAKASSSVSKKTDFVLVGENPGSKLAKAVKLGVQVINELEFMGMIRGRTR